MANTKNRRYEISDDDYERIKPLLSGKPGDPGRNADDNRAFINAVLWIARTGAPWEDLPERYGKPNTVFQRFNRWAKKGCWLSLDTGNAMPIRVLVPRADDGYEFTVPTTLRGQATVFGTLRTVELDAATQEHLEGDGAAPSHPQEVQILASGILVKPDA